ncbi:MAG: discoidin domain-containing protein [Clostridia bacterium]|nr:discoidin domain-containing protein [Clostridia bacterium]
MKKVTACLITACLILSLMVMPASAENISAQISGRRTDTEASFTVLLENAGSRVGYATVYIAAFEADLSFKEVEKHIVEIPGTGSISKVYPADISEGEVRVYVWDGEGGMLPLDYLSSEECERVESLEGELISIGIDDVWASNTLDASLAVDSNTATKWSTEADGDSITIYLGGDYILSSAVFDFDTENASYLLLTSEDGESFTPVGEETETAVKSISAGNVRARYVRLTLTGTAGVREVSLYGFPDDLGTILMSREDMAKDWHISAMSEMTYTNYTPMTGDKLYGKTENNSLVLYDAVGREGSKIEIQSVTASQTPESSNKPSNVLDSDKSTIWTASNVTDLAPATLVADLGSLQTVTGVGIAFGNGASRTYTYSIEVSSNNSGYTTAVAKTTAQSTDNIQIIEFTPLETRFIRFTFYERVDSSNNGWIRISEIEAYKGSAMTDGAGGVMAQKELNVPQNRGDYEIEFDMEVASRLDGEETDAYYTGISLVDETTTGGADLVSHAAIQLRLGNSEGKVSIKQAVSNYFNEGSLTELFEKTFNKDEKLHFSLLVSPEKRSCFVTVSDSLVTETQLVHFSYSDAELARNRAWAYNEPGVIVFNTGAGSKNKITVTNLQLREVARSGGEPSGVDPTHGIVRLEATRLSSYPSGSDGYGRYMYHNGKNSHISVAANKNPALTRFVERRGLIGTGVSFESVTLPGYYITCEMGDAYYLRKFENNGQFLANATFYKEEAENVGYYTGNTYKYRTYLTGKNSSGTEMEDKYLYDSTSDFKTGDMKPWKMWEEAQGTFYLRNEGTAYVSDNFYGDSISSQWWKNYPWKGNNPTNDSYNFTALITKNNVIVKNGELLLKATKIASDAWPTDASGETGKQYNGDYGRNDWKKWQGYVGVVSIQNKVYNKQCFIEGKFKDPNSPIGYWNAFWLTGRDSWPPEIDIFETLSSKYGHYAWHTAIHGEGDTNNRFGKMTSGTNIATSYNTFSVDWGYDYIKFYLNGNLFASTQNDATLNFQKNMRLIMNTGIGGWENEPDDSMVWDDGLRCQYIRSFQY